MKKLINTLLALALCGAFFVPAYAEDSPAQPAQPETQTTNPPDYIIVSSEIIMSDIAQLPTADPVIIPEPETPENNNNNNGAGVIENPQPTQASQTGNGSGTLIEDVSDNQVNRQFIKVQSRGGNIFYIIIDKDEKSENVYFLNAVDDFDLLSFSENFPDGVIEAYEELKEETARLEAERLLLENQSDENPETPKSRANINNDEEKEKPAGINNIYILVGIGGLFLGGLLYFKVIKPKKGGGKSGGNDFITEDEQEDEDE